MHTRRCILQGNSCFPVLRCARWTACGWCILGQDPYIHAHQAHGLCFSVNRGEKLPPSLRNIYKELSSDLGIEAPAHGCLAEWAAQGILMMNAVMTVEAGKSGSHRGRGWETFTDHAIRFVSDYAAPSVFVLWGKWAQKADAHRSGPASHSFGSTSFSAIGTQRFLWFPPVLLGQCGVA